LGGYYFIWHWNFGLVGFGILKFVVEIITMIGLVIVMTRVCPAESFKWEKFSVVMDCGGFCKYVKEFAKIVFGWYAYYAGSECITILIGMLKNVNLMAAWVFFLGLKFRPRFSIYRQLCG
jgi:hypothetical protein